MAFFVAINVILSFVAIYVPILSIIFILILPLTSAVVEIRCKDRYFPIYAFATIGLSIVVSLSQIDFTLFYVVPSIFAGYIFGLAQKKNIPDMFSIFLASLIQMVLSVLLINILNLISGTNLLEILRKILGISNDFVYKTLLLFGFFIVSLVQTILSFIVVKNELQKLGGYQIENKDDSLFASVAILASVILLVLSAIFYLPLAYLFMAFSFYFGTYVVIFETKNKNKMLLILDIVFFLIGIFVYGIFNSYLSSGKDFLLFSVIPALVAIASLFHKIGAKKSNL